MSSESNAIQRFGDADYCDAADIRAAGYFDRTPDSVFLGFFEGRKLWYSGLGGIVTEAGARSGKLRDVLGYNLCPELCEHHIWFLDMKGEGAAISRNARRRRIYINPHRLHGLPCARINPVAYLRAGSVTLVSDVKVFCQNAIVLSGAAQSSFFEQRAREFLEAIVLTLVRLHGQLTLPDLYHAINQIPAGGQAWLDFAFEMQECGYPIAARIEEEIAQARKDSSGGQQGILAEVLKAFSCLSDDLLMASVSPPFDFGYEELSATGDPVTIYMMTPAKDVDGWALFIKSHLVNAMIEKERAPQARRQTWILDELGQLGGFPLIPKLFSYAAGIGIRPWAIVQSREQLSLLAPSAKSIILSSAAVQQYFAIRDIKSAKELSDTLGAQTLVWEDEKEQARARHASHQALNRLFDGDDAFGPMLDYAHYAREAEMPSKQYRLLQTPAEIITMPSDKQVIIADRLRHPIDGERSPYFEQRWTIYNPNPFYPPLDKVRVKTWYGHAWLRVIEEPVPSEFAHLPQYADGRWTRIEPRKWWQI